MFAPKPLTSASIAAMRAVRDSSLPDVPVTYDVREEQWKLLSDYTVELRNQAKTRITVPGGFRFDLASIPRSLWWLIAPNELSIVAPLIHDALYVYKGDLPVNLVAPWRKFSRLDADNIFFELMERESVSVWRRNAAYAAVRTFGKRWWAD